MHSLQVENGLSVGHNEEKVERALLHVSYVPMSTWTCLCQNLKGERFR